jgi:hypothetical protein
MEEHSLMIHKAPLELIQTRLPPAGRILDLGSKLYRRPVACSARLHLLVNPGAEKSVTV